MSGFWWGLLGVAVSIVWAEFTEWTPWLAKRIVRAAVKRVPEAQRERAAEELTGLLEEAPGKLWKLYTACSLWWGFSREHLRPMVREIAMNATMRSVDIAGALAFFVLLFPVYLSVAIAVRLSSPGPAHFWQTRLGKDGKTFRFYKFRSMVRNSEEVLDEYLEKNHKARTAWENFETLDRDPRITPIGRFIRMLSLDELPQFVNVLKGDMSLIGPRPCMERQRELYGEHWESYCKVRPGITGLWQVSGRNRLSYAERVELDVAYVKNRSLWMNVKILVRTVTVVITGSDPR